MLYLPLCHAFAFDLRKQAPAHTTTSKMTELCWYPRVMVYSGQRRAQRQPGRQNIQAEHAVEQASGPEHQRGNRRSDFGGVCRSLETILESKTTSIKLRCDTTFRAKEMKQIGNDIALNPSTDGSDKPSIKDTNLTTTMLPSMVWGLNKPTPTSRVRLVTGACSPVAVVSTSPTLTSPAARRIVLLIWT